MKILLALFFFLTLAAARAATTDELLEQIKAAVREEVKAGRDGNDPNALGRLHGTQQLLHNLDRSSGDESSEQGLWQAVEALGAQTTSEKLAELCRTLAKQLRAEAETRDTALVAEMEKTFAEALRTGLVGQTIKELDAPMAAVQRLVQEAGGRQTSNVKLRALTNQGQQLGEFLRQWQDHLAGIDDGNSGNARSRLQNLLGSGRDFSAFMPRSELLTRIAELRKKHGAPPELMTPEEYETKAREILLATKRLEDMAGAIEQLDALSRVKRSSGSESQWLSTALQHLRTYQRIYAELNGGLATNISLSPVVTTAAYSTSETTLALRNQLLLFALPRVLGLPEGRAAKAGDNLATYLQGVAVEAREKSDWPLLDRAIELAQTLNAGTTAISIDRTALQSFLAGLNQERAGQFALAVGSFQAALKTGSQVISAERIGEHLERIRKEQPEDFKKGVQYLLNPPAAYDPRFPTRPGYPGYPYPPGYPGPRSTPEPTSIEVPAATPAPAAAPAPPPAAVPPAAAAK